MNNWNRVQVALLTSASVLFASSCDAADNAAPPLDPSFRRLTLGAWKITALSDGTTRRNVGKLVTKISATDVETLMGDRSGPPEVELSINAFLIDDGQQRILIDTGAGDLFKPEAGLVPRSLARAGYAPDEINAVVLTHIHADHSGGLVQDAKKTYPNAMIYVPQKDADLFLNKDAAAAAPPELQHVWRDAELTIGPYLTGNRVRTYDSNASILPGVSSLPAPGHTPGHSAIVLVSRGEKLVVLGDVIHVAEIQFPRPDAAVMLDVDQDAAVSQRVRLLEDAAAGGYLVAFAHVAFPGIGHVRKSPDRSGFVWAPIP